MEEKYRYCGNCKVFNIFKVAGYLGPRRELPCAGQQHAAERQRCEAKCFE